MLNKRSLLKAMGALPVAHLYANSTEAHAQPYPIRSVTLVAPYAAGNTADMSGRLVAQQLGTLLGQSIVVDNRPGAGGVSAVKMVSNASPDGYTLFLSGTAMAITQSLFKPPPYDMLKSFVPVSLLTATDVLILVRNESKLRSLSDLIQISKSKKDGVMIGVTSLGTTQHLSAELLKINAKIDYTIVPFKSAAALNAALIAGEIDAEFELISTMSGLLQGGQVRALAIGSEKRSEILPDVPTVSELGVPHFEVMAWGMIVAPVNTPDEIVQLLNRNIQKVIAQPEVAQRFKDYGQRVMGGTAAYAQEFLKNEISKWGRVIGDAKISFK